MNSCSTCTEGGTIECCHSIFCENCISFHLMQIKGSKHKPFVLGVPNPELSQALYTMISNEILELEEFNTSSKNMVLQFRISLKGQIDTYLDNILASLNQQYQQTLADLQKALSCTYLNSFKNEILDNFSDQFTPEMIKQTHLCSKSLSIPTLDLTPHLENIISFNISINISSKPKPIAKQQSYIPISHSQSELGLIARTQSSVLPSSKFRVLNFSKPIFDTLFCLTPFSNLLFQYNVKQRTLASLNIDSVRFPSKSAWTLTQDGRLMITGGFDESARKSAYLLHLHNNRCEEIKAMSFARFNHSILRIENCVYVIGGVSKATIKECERYNLDNKKWSKFASLVVPRECPSVCCLLGKIYVAGGVGAESIECSQIIKEKFELLMIRMPSPGKCSMFALNGEIIILNKTRNFKLTFPGAVYKEIGNGKDCVWWSSSEYLVYDKEVYWVAEGKFIWFDVEKGAAGYVEESL